MYVACIFLLESIVVFFFQPKDFVSPCAAVLCLVDQLCLTLFDPMDCSPSGSSICWDSPGKNTGVGGHAFLQGIFPIQGPKTWVSHIAHGFFTIWTTREAQEYWRGNLFLLQGIFPTQESNRGPLHCRWILYQLCYQGTPFSLLTRNKIKNFSAFIARLLVLLFCTVLGPFHKSTALCSHYKQL